MTERMKREMAEQERLEAMPKPTRIDHESRISFGIDWYATEEDALIASAQTHSTYNGGDMHKTWDRKDEDGNVTAWAVTC